MRTTCPQLVSCHLQPILLCSPLCFSWIHRCIHIWGMVTQQHLRIESPGTMNYNIWPIWEHISGSVAPLGINITPQYLEGLFSLYINHTLIQPNKAPLIKSIHFHWMEPSVKFMLLWSSLLYSPLDVLIFLCSNCTKLSSFNSLVPLTVSTWFMVCPVHTTAKISHKSHSSSVSCLLFSPAAPGPQCDVMSNTEVLKTKRHAP